MDASRLISLTPYLEWPPRRLPRVTAFVFASPTAASGRITEPRKPHAEVLAGAGIPHVSIHGLRRLFALLGEVSGAPASAIAQAMGHKPSAIAERYLPRSMDALRGYLAHVERFILDKAGVQFDATKAVAGGLRVVA